jgi:hypothetical protein
MMLSGTTRRPDEVIGLIPPNLSECTVEKAAANAVMAGCRPEYFPVVLAVIETALDPRFSMHGLLATLYFSGPVIIVNGPIAKRIGMNSQGNALGQGNRANATIGRALQLVIRNVGGGRPGEVDRATLGNPGKYTFCFAETEDDHPWEPLSVSRGCAPSDSAVTVIATNSLYQVYNQLAATPEPLLLCFADALANLGSPNLKGFNESLIVLAGEHAEVLRASGWSRRQMQQFLIDHARRRVADLKRAGRLPGVVAPEDETTWRHVFERPDDILIACAGGRAGSWSACLPGWGTKWTRSVTTRIEIPGGTA